MCSNIVAGRILWVQMPPERGQDRIRPAVVLLAPDADGYVGVVAGSASGEPDNPDHAFELPWDSEHPCRTGLRKRTVIDLMWRTRVHLNDIKKAGGVLPGPALAEMQERIRALTPELGEPTT